MTDIDFDVRWLGAPADRPEFEHTTGEFLLKVGDIHLTCNEDCWARTIRDSVLVSVYPLAFWMAASWWRLCREPLPEQIPSVDWRMSHELGAANEGYVWPRILFASDGEIMQVWAKPSSAGEEQSVRYLNGLERPAAIPLDRFRRRVEMFVDAVLGRLSACGVTDTDLHGLWRLVREERADPDQAAYRNLEAEMGYDPGECPEARVREALALAGRVGAGTLSELAPVYGVSSVPSPAAAIEEIAESPGLEGTPRVAILERENAPPAAPPWQRAVSAASRVREAIGNSRTAIGNDTLCDLLGLRIVEMERWSPTGRRRVALGVRGDDHRIKFIPRKKHPVARRFEWARFLADYLAAEPDGRPWLASTDLGTARQKFQRAFAAVFLCPIDALREFLEEDYSESAMEDAAEHFQVSPRTVESLLVNNGLIAFSGSGVFPEVGMRFAFPVV